MRSVGAVQALVLDVHLSLLVMYVLGHDAEGTQNSCSGNPDLLYHGTRELSLQAPTGERPGSCLLPHVCNPAEQSCIVFHGVVNGPGMRCISSSLPV